MYKTIFVLIFIDKINFPVELKNTYLYGCERLFERLFDLYEYFLYHNGNSLYNLNAIFQSPTTFTCQNLNMSQIRLSSKLHLLVFQELGLEFTLSVMTFKPG